MTLTEILPSLRQLNNQEKLKAIRFLASEISESENEARLESGKEYPVYSVYDSFEAGDAMMKLLERENAKLKAI